MADWDMNFTDPQETNIPSVNESQTPEQVDAQVIPEQPPVNEPQAPEQIEAKTIPEQPFTAQPTAQQQPLFTPYPQFTFEQSKKKKGGKAGLIWGLIAATVISCFVSIMATNIIWGEKFNQMQLSYHNRINVLEEQLKGATVTRPSTNASKEPVTDEMLPAQVYEACVNTVVAIQSAQTSPGYFGQTSKSYSTGSGVILSEDGYIATNYHVVEGGTSISVITHDGQEYTAELVGYDQSNDIAVLKVEATDLPYATVGSSDSLLVGDKVAAIGNPLGELTATMTVGYISAKDRLVSTDGTAINMLQTDAAINSGNSGGPLFNMYGQVVGITTAKYSGTSTSGASIEGIGFAIPIDDVVGIIDDLMNYGYVTGAYLGVMVREIDSSVAQTYGLPMGVRVEEVTPGYCAEAAGIQQGDIIIDLGGHKVTCMSDLSRALRKFKAGDDTTITVFRRGAEVHLSIVLSEKPQEVPQQQQQSIMP